jgi:Stress responsive A/B Barrel Domain
MLIHCSLFKLKPQTSPEVRDRIVTEFRELGLKIPYIRQITAGINTSDFSVIRRIAASKGVSYVQEGYDLAVIIHLDSIEDYYAYCADESHWELVRQFLLPNQAERASIQMASD